MGGGVYRSGVCGNNPGEHSQAWEELPIIKNIVNEESTRSVDYQDILVLVLLPIQQVCQVLGCIMMDQKGDFSLELAFWS